MFSNLVESIQEATTDNLVEELTKEVVEDYTITKAGSIGVVQEIKMSGKPSVLVKFSKIVNDTAAYSVPSVFYVNPLQVKVIK